MRSLFVLVCLSLIVGCGDSGVVQPAQDSGAKDTVVDGAAPVDTNQPDTVASDTAQADTGTSSTCEPGEGCFGESCDSADDCLSGICTMHLGDKVCSKTCDEACPVGWDCTLVGTGGDGQYVCLSQFSHLCLPCSDAGTCSGETPNACVKYGDGTSFCGGACDLETPCPSGYSCQEVTATNGAKNYQCVSTAGVCHCSNLAIDSGLSSPCEVTSEVGTCTGVRLCQEDGLSECTADEAAPEVCNGIDDDCNGLVDEGSCDDGNACTEDSCAGEAGCQHTPIDQGECLDGDACTIGDHCETGVCVGKPIDCEDGNPCTTDSCDGLGGCASTPAVSVCDDGDPCTLGDICTDSVCKGSATLTCDDGNPCTDDSCGENGCIFAANTLGCDDENACTATDTCAEGSCKGSQVACDDGDLCTTDSCAIESGCVNSHNTQPCDDGDVCTLGDACDAGSCAAGAKSLACDDGNPCTDDACDEALGCVFSPNTADCDDNNSCTTGDSCVEGNCIGLGSLACDDGNPCTLDSCFTEGGCTHTASAGACDDGEPCTVNDSCADGACASGLILSCDDGNPCTDEACEGGDCVFTANTAPCDDGNACTTTSGCDAGACAGSEGVDCDDGNLCTTDGCDPLTGCVHVNNQSPCFDGDLCTLGDMCQDGSCLPVAAPLACDDGNICTSDACDPKTGCTHAPNIQDCSDDNVCTVGEQCAGGWCLSSQTLDCDDEDPCTDDACDAATGCTHANNTLPCDDGDVCTTGGNCKDGACGDGLQVICDDEDPCTDDSCDALQGCKTIDNTAPCDDGVACTLDDACSNGACAGDPCVVQGLVCYQDACVTHYCGDGVCDGDKGENGANCFLDCEPDLWLASNEVEWYPVYYPFPNYLQSLAVQTCKDNGLRLWRDEVGSADSSDWVYDVNNSHNLGGHDIGYKVDNACSNGQEGHTGTWVIFGQSWADSLKETTGASNGSDVYILNKQAHAGDFETTAAYTVVKPQSDSVTFVLGEYSATADGMSYAVVLCAKRK